MKTIHQYAEQAIMDEINKIKSKIAKETNEWKNAVEGLAKAKDPMIFTQPGLNRFKSEEDEIKELETLLNKIRAGES